VIYSPFLDSSGVPFTKWISVAPSDSMMMMAGNEELWLTVDSNCNGGLIYLTFRIFYTSEVKEGNVK
jgi:hypothetical protein